VLCGGCYFGPFLQFSQSVVEEKEKKKVRIKELAEL
jgi:hypothetical protein